MTKCGESGLELEACPSILSAAVHGIDHLFVYHTKLGSNILEDLWSERRQELDNALDRGRVMELYTYGQ